MLSFVWAASELTVTPCEEVGAEAVRSLRQGLQEDVHGVAAKRRHLATGKWSSENTGPLYAAAVEQEDKDLLSRLVSKKNPVLSEAKQWEVLMEHARKEEWEEGLKVFETLSRRTRKQRALKRCGG